MPATPTIGVGITTRNRRNLLDQSLTEWRRNLPEGALLVVVDDASETPYPDAAHRFDRQAGIARAKNKCIELLMNAGVEHLFLADDDTWPLLADWWQPYVASPEPHLMHLFKDVDWRTPGKCTHLTSPRTLWDDGTHYAQAHPRGDMLYLHRTVVERVGGMRPEFGTWGYEHVEYSRRIYDAGLTTWPFADAADGRNIWYNSDEHFAEIPGFARAVPHTERTILCPKNETLTQLLAGRTDCVDFRERPTPEPVGTKDIILSVLITGAGPDPQQNTVDKNRPAQLTPDPAHIATWLESLKGHDVVVLNDQLTCKNTKHVTYVHVPTAPMNVYAQRWLHTWQYLRANPDIRRIWVTDCTDVQLLRNPWANMQPGRIHVGSEPGTIGRSGWLRIHHPSLRGFMRTYADRQIINPGVIGGTRTDVMAYLHHFLTEWWDWTSPGDSDMGLWNLVAWMKHPDQIDYGPHVTTVFKAYADNGTAKWMHK
jgi:hypothetical protein